VVISQVLVVLYHSVFLYSYFWRGKTAQFHQISITRSPVALLVEQRK